MASYKVVPCPTVIAGDTLFGGAGGNAIERVSEAISQIMAVEAKQGWRLHLIDETTIQNACLGCFSQSTARAKLLVFVRD